MENKGREGGMDRGEGKVGEMEGRKGGKGHFREYDESHSIILLLLFSTFSWIINLRKLTSFSYTCGSD